MIVSKRSAGLEFALGVLLTGDAHLVVHAEFGETVGGAYGHGLEAAGIRPDQPIRGELPWMSRMGNLSPTNWQFRGPAIELSASDGVHLAKSSVDEYPDTNLISRHAI